MQRYENVIIALVLLLLDGYWLKMTMALPQNASTTLYGPRFFPQVIMIGILLCRWIFFWKGVQQKSYVSKDGDVIKCQEGNRNKVLALLVLFLGYIILFEQIGFFLSSVIYIILAQIVFGIRNKIILCLVSPGVILVLNILFVIVFKIPVP